MKEVELKNTIVNTETHVKVEKKSGSPIITSHEDGLVKVAASDGVLILEYRMQGGVTVEKFIPLSSIKEVTVRRQENVEKVPAGKAMQHFVDKDGAIAQFETHVGLR